MKIFIAVEVQQEASDLLTIANEFEEKLNRIIMSKDCGYYGNEFEELAIIPTCMDDDFWCGLGWKEKVTISRKKKEAEARLRIDFDKYINSSTDYKRVLFAENIITSLEKIDEKAKNDFNKERLIASVYEVLKLLNS